MKNSAKTENLDEKTHYVTLLDQKSWWDGRKMEISLNEGEGQSHLSLNPKENLSQPVSVFMGILYGSYTITALHTI